MQHQTSLSRLIKSDQGIVIVINADLVGQGDQVRALELIEDSGAARVGLERAAGQVSVELVDDIACHSHTNLIANVGYSVPVRVWRALSGTHGSISALPNVVHILHVVGLLHLVEGAIGCAD